MREDIVQGPQYKVFYQPWYRMYRDLRHNLSWSYMTKGHN